MDTMRRCVIFKFRRIEHRSLQSRMKAAPGASPLHPLTTHACQHIDAFLSAASSNDIVAYLRIHTTMRGCTAPSSHARQTAMPGLACVRCAAELIPSLSLPPKEVHTSTVKRCGQKSLKELRTMVRSTIAAKETTLRCINTTSGPQHNLAYKKRTYSAFRRNSTNSPSTLPHTAVVTTNVKIADNGTMCWK